jgi:PD-(D/E)XK endonuclease
MRKTHWIHLRHAKARGECTELRFMTRASELGFRLTKPWGDNSSYDLALDYQGRFRRIQVKSTQQKRWNSYRCCISANGVPYTPHQIDFIAAYVIPTDTWYIIPIEDIPNQPEILLSPHRKNSKHAKYKEAWHLLKR